MAVSRRLRYEILRRDNHTCRYCGRTAPDVKLTLDHVVPTTLGGSDEPENLVAACADCNAGKSSVPADAPLVDDVKQDALRWARAMEIAGAGNRAERYERDQRRQAFYSGWSAWSFEQGGKRYLIGDLPSTWEASIDAFWKAGLDQDDIDEAIDVAMQKKHVRTNGLFKYFCGICWRMLDERRETATAIVHLLENEEGDS